MNQFLQLNSYDKSFTFTHYLMYFCYVILSFILHLKSAIFIPMWLSVPTHEKFTKILKILFLLLNLVHPQTCLTLVEVDARSKDPLSTF